ncbi:acetolactate synthase [Gordonia sp. TBRC 11910]|uniref:acetolactate synthase n=1 Tax=Gordonia asplenii TaxID=2725283 RepID=A0A848KR31_9ACTN|nr:thiamine pyrophosphate-binding protein [Gordonia asplenii]NMO00387.1 acetolactate synthase [Gordonia asplenii]
MSATQTDHRNGGAAIVESIAAHGIDVIFGIPGTHNLELYRHLRSSGIRAITPRHEQGAGYAAEAYSRVTGRPSVVITTSGPGLTNALTAAATAWAESQPMLIVSPGPEVGTEGTDIGRLHETKSTSKAADALVEWSRRVTTADEAADAVTDAFEFFATGRPRPVHIEVPLDVLEQPWTGVARVAPTPPPPVAGADDIARAAGLLAAARTPLIVAGGGAVDAAPQVRRLAELLDAPVATTCNGKGVLDESHPLAVGASVRLPALHAAAAASDGLLVVGSELGDSDLWEGRIQGAVTIRLDIEEGQLQKNSAADVALLGDAAATLEVLCDAIESGTRAPVEPSGRAGALRAECAAQARADAGVYADINQAVRAALPADGILTGDSSQVTYLGSVHFFDVPAPRRFCYTAGFATLGYGLPAGIGALLAEPARPVVTVLGDGAFMFSVQELITAVELRLTLPIVVVDSGGYAEIKGQEAIRAIEPIGVDLAVPDFAAMAIAFGANGVRLTEPTDLTEAVRVALAADGPTLIHLDIRALI